MSVTYPNVGNLVIPLVAAILGADWVIYTSAFIVVQTILFWSHGKAVLCGDRKFEFKKVFGSINMICVFVGMGLFFTGIRLPALLHCPSFTGMRTTMHPMWAKTGCSTPFKVKPRTTIKTLLHIRQHLRCFTDITLYDASTNH